MTDNEQRICIAELCGWEHMPNAAGLMWCHKENRAVITPGSEVEKARLRMKMPYEPGKHTLPDFLNDLNAMADAERHLMNQFKDDWSTYWRHLAGIQPHPIFATARQRAEAFLRTVGRWKE